MGRFRWLGAVLVGAAVLGCGAHPSRGTGAVNRDDGVIESIDHVDRPSAGVAGILAGGSLSTPAGNGALKPAGAGSKGLVAGAVASALTQPFAPQRADEPGYRVTVRLDSGSLRSVAQADVAALRVGQRVHVERNLVLPLESVGSAAPSPSR